MSDERRDRYAAALFERANPGFRWVDLQEGLPDHDHWLDEAEAAMAVADEELDTSTRQLDARRIELLQVNKRHATAIEGLSRALVKNQMRVERARAVLDQTNPGEYVTNYSRKRENGIRAALDGSDVGQLQKRVSKMQQDIELASSGHGFPQSLDCE
ncbi:hypothetical protein [Streptomyces decoyicus]